MKKKVILILSSFLVSQICFAESYLVNLPKAEFSVRELNTAQANQLKSDGYEVELNQKAQLFTPTFNFASAAKNWALEMIQSPQAQTVASRLGEGLTLCVIDTGIDRAHPMIGDALIGGINLVEDEDPNDYSDSYPHGTFVASLAAGRSNGQWSGVAPAAKIYSIKIFGEESSTTTIESIVKALQHSIGRCNVINMSFGGLSRSPILEQALKAASDSGITLVAAAGNSGSRLSLPASSPYVIAVGSVDEDKQISKFSNRGSEMDFVAPGNKVPVLRNDGSVWLASGTSFSSPLVAGVELLRQSHKNSGLVADDLGVSAQMQGLGLINALKTVSQ